MKNIRKFLITFMLFLGIVLPIAGNSYAKEYLEADMKVSGKDEIIVEVENKSEDVLKNLKFDFSFDKNIKLKEQAKTLKTLNSGEKYSFKVKVENNKKDTVKESNSRDIPRTAIPFFGYTGVVLSSIALIYLIFKKKSIQRFFVLFVFLFTTIFSNFKTTDANELKYLNDTQEFKRVLHILDEDTNTTLKVNFDRIDDKEVGNITIPNNVEGTGNITEVNDTVSNNNSEGPLITIENNDRDIVLISGMIYDSSDELIEEGSFELYQNDKKIQKIDLKQEDEGYIYFHIDKNKEYILKNDKVEIKILAKKDNDINVENIKGKFELGKLYKDDVAKVRFRPSTIVLSEAFDYDVDIKTATITIDQKYELKAGDVLILPANNKYMYGFNFRVVSSSISKDKTIVKITYIEDQKEIISLVEYKEIVSLDKMMFTPAEGVEVIDKNKKVEDPMNRSWLSISGNGEESISLSDKLLKKNEDDISLTISFTGTIAYDYTIDLIDTERNNLYTKFTLEKEVNIEANEVLSGDKTVKFGDLEYPIGPYLTIKGELSGYIDASGQFSINVNYKKTDEVEFHNGKINKSDDTELSFGASLSGEAVLGIKLTGKLYVLSGPTKWLFDKATRLFKISDNSLIKIEVKGGLSLEGEFSVKLLSYSKDENVKILKPDGKIELYTVISGGINVPILEKIVKLEGNIEYKSLVYKFPKEKIEEVSTKEGRKELSDRISNDVIEDIKKTNPNNDADILLLIDNSHSMNFKLYDNELSRLDATNAVVRNIIDDLFKSGLDIRIGILNYAGDTRLLQEFTNDKELLINSLPKDTNSATFTQNGLYESRKLLDKSNSKKKILIHITDGVPNRVFKKTGNSYNYDQYEYFGGLFASFTFEDLKSALLGVEHEQKILKNSGVNVYNVGMLLLQDDFKDIEDVENDESLKEEVRNIVKQTFSTNVYRYYDIREKVEVDLTE